MLVRLIIQNYAIIPALDIPIRPGLTVITGETGAGKSILLGALGLALGKRADFKVLPDEDSKCIVEAHFALQNELLKSFFIREELDYNPLLICRREISSGGRSRSFINDTPVSLKTLQELTGHLIELHHQHDNLALQNRDYQIQVLDTISGSLPLFREYTLLYDKLIREKNELLKMQELEHTSQRRKDFLTFQLEELQQAKLTSGEIASLEESQNILEHAEAIDQVLAQMQHVLNDGPHSMTQQLTGLIKQIESIRQVYPPIVEIADRVENMRVEVQDLSLESSRLDSPGPTDPAKLARVQGRLNQLYTLIKKYQCRDEAQLLDVFNGLNHELSTLLSVRDDIEALEEKINQTTGALLEKGAQLTKQRKSGVKKLIPGVIGLLHELGMPNAQFDIEIKSSSAPGPLGYDDINFLFSANKGSPLLPLQAVASGGELSRLSLTMKSIYAAQAELPTLIFDEIDTGISGEVAWRMGQLIRTLAKGHQVLMISHSPQIAAHASVQYHVSKMTVGEKDVSDVQYLSPKQRLNELAKMLSGDPPSKAALSNAESLIKAVKN